MVGGICERPFCIKLGETWLFCGRRVVADVLLCGGRLLELVDSVRCGACLELLCELYGVGGRRRINCVEVEAILYIDMGGRLVWEAINRCWGGR